MITLHTPKGIYIFKDEPSAQLAAELYVKDLSKFLKTFKTHKHE